MKKKIWIIPLVTIIAILVLLISGAGVLIFRGFDASAGIYVEAGDGSDILIDKRTPIHMSNRTGRDLFSRLDSGEKVLVIHDGIAETYPARTGVYAVFRITSGVTGALPSSVIEELIELGWIETAEDVHFGSPSGETADKAEN